MTLAYLATPYTRYRGGLDRAHADAAKLAARLLIKSIMVYSPIVHCHPLARAGDLDPLNIDLWYAHNETMMSRCDSLIVANMLGWRDSKGIEFEVNFFLHANKPIFDLNPQTLTMKRRIGIPEVL